MSEHPPSSASAFVPTGPAKAAVLSEALPYMRRYAGKTIVVKYGGHAMVDAALGDSFARDVVLLKQVGIYPIVVTGGGSDTGPMPVHLPIMMGVVDGAVCTAHETMAHV